ncbi:MAG: pyridoxal phosphate-dependent aminotransferase, partial [Halobacteriales archaeon]
LDGMWERTITINGFSKSHCMTGFRLGYLAAPEALIDQVGKVHSHSVSCAGNFIQHAGIEALEGTDTDAFTGEMVETFRERRDLLVDLFEERGFDMPVPEGSFYAMIPIETDDDMAWCKRAAREAKIGLVPGSAFNTPGYARASLVDSTERIREGVENLADAGFI